MTYIKPIKTHFRHKKKEVQYLAVAYVVLVYEADTAIGAPMDSGPVEAASDCFAERAMPFSKEFLP